jgi:hypothetical protein
LPSKHVFIIDFAIDIIKKINLIFEQIETREVHLSSKSSPVYYTKITTGTHFVFIVFIVQDVVLLSKLQKMNHQDTSSRYNSNFNTYGNGANGKLRSSQTRFFFKEKFPRPFKKVSN